MKIRFAILGLGAGILGACQNGTTIPSGQAELKTSLDSVSYAVGVSMGKQLAGSPLKNVDLALLAKGFQDALNKSESLKEEQIMVIVQNYMMKQSQSVAEENLAKGKKFLEENKKKEGVIALPSGIQYKILNEGTGPDTVSVDRQLTVHYHGTHIDGKVFDSSVERGQPFIIEDLRQMITGWIILVGMKVGTKLQLFIPPDKAYGIRGSGPIEPNETLIFEVEIISVK